MRSLALAAIAFLLTSCFREEQKTVALPQLERPEFYTSEAIDLRVVDDSGAPLQGVAVVVNWRKIYCFTGRWGGLYHWFEGRTDADGRLRVPRWGPRTLDFDYYLDARDPEIWLLRRGHLPGYFDNEGLADPRLQTAGAQSLGKEPPHLTFHEARERFSRAATAGSIWNGRPLTLRRATSSEDMLRMLEAANPIDEFEPAPPRLTMWWDEWSAAATEIPPDLRKQIRPPKPFMRVQLPK